MQHLRKILGQEYEGYCSRLLDNAEVDQKEFFSIVTPADFGKAILSVDYNDTKSIHKFEKILLKPNVMPIVIGTLKGTLLKLSAEPYVLEPHELEVDELLQINDERLAMPTAIVGIWSTKGSYRNSHYSDEGCPSSDATQRLPTPVAALEVFHQLGLLHSYENSLWQKTNYALVRNVYDDSIWVIWRKYILRPDTADHDLAKDVWNKEYAVFPGMEGERAIFARIADNWDWLRPDTDLRSSRIFRAPSHRNQVEEPLLVSASRTKEGGIRRQNDFRATWPRHS